MTEQEKQQAPAKKIQLVFEMDLETGAIGWHIPNGLPRAAFVNALEMCKHMLIIQQLAVGQIDQQPGIMLPNGSPLPKLR